MDTNIAEQVLAEYADFVDARDVVDIPGLSSPRVCRFLNRLVSRMDPGEHYLEIGTWQGKTLLSAAYDNPGRICVGCDKFRLWAPYTGFGVVAKRALFTNLARYRGRTADVRFHAMTSARLFARGFAPAPVGIYFYDGDHSYQATRHGIVAVAQFLSDRAVLVMDDWKDPVIRRATAHGLREAQLRVLWHRTLGSDDPTPRAWWNGLGVFYVEHPTRAWQAA